MSNVQFDISSPHQYIILFLSCFSFVGISALLLTCHYHRDRIPRNPVIITLLITNLPRILVLFMPFVIEGTLQTQMPYHEQDRTPEQQGTPLAKFCIFQGLAATYLLGTHSAFIVSLTIFVVHTLRHPYIYPKRESSFFNLALCIGPFLYTLPLPILGLCIALLTPHKDHVIFYQGSYCNVDVYAFAFTSQFMIGLPLIIALGILAWGVWTVVRFYLRTRFHSETGNGRKKKQFLHLPPLSIILRLGLLVFEVGVTSVMFILQGSLSDLPRETIFKIDRYWEAVVPLLEFLIFASQSAVLQVWFPKYFETDMGRLLQVQEKRHSKAVIGQFNLDLERAIREKIEGGEGTAEVKPRISLRLSTSSPFSLPLHHTNLDFDDQVALETPGSGPSKLSPTTSTSGKDVESTSVMSNEEFEEGSTEFSADLTPQPPPAIPTFLRPMPAAHTTTTNTHSRKASVSTMSGRPTRFPER